jgi:hypothetical protein
MAYSFTNSKKQTYYLHVKKIKRASGKETQLFFFSREARPGQTLDSLPAGYKVAEMKTGLPVLKKI